MSARITRLSGHAEVISPASSMPTGPAPSRSTDSAAASSALQRAVLRRRRRGLVHVALGRERIARSGREDQEVGADLLARAQHHALGGHCRPPGRGRPGRCSTAVVGQEDARSPGRVHDGAQGADVVDEGVAGLDEHDVGEVVERTCGDGAAVAAADRRRPVGEAGGVRSCAHITACARIHACAPTPPKMRRRWNASTTKAAAGGSALFGLLFIHSHVVRPIDDAVERAHQTNLTGFELLLRLENLPEGASVRYLSDQVVISPSRVSRVADDLVRPGAPRARRLGARRPALTRTADRRRTRRDRPPSRSTFLQAVSEHLPTTSRPPRSTPWPRSPRPWAPPTASGLRPGLSPASPPPSSPGSRSHHHADTNHAAGRAGANARVDGETCDARRHPATATHSRANCSPMRGCLNPTELIYWWAA